MSYKSIFAILSLFCCCNAFGIDYLDERISENIVYKKLASETKGKDFIFRINTYHPPGKGPFPLVIMNHGIDPSGNSERVRFQVAAREFVERGYVVMVPQRRGFGGSEGPRDWPDCAPAEYAKNAQKEVLKTLQVAKEDVSIDMQQVIIVGHSVGGLVSLQSLENSMPGVKGVINVAGGFMWPNCEWQKPLIQFVSSIKKPSLPSLWLYSANDKLFSPDLAKKMHTAFKQNGGRAELVILDSFKDDGHLFFPAYDGVDLWWPETEKFLKKLGLPTEIKFPVKRTITPKPSSFAKNNDFDKIPFDQYNKKNGVIDYINYLNKKHPKAFAIDENGTAWGWSTSMNSIDEALERCNANTNSYCKLYSIDDEVVWNHLEKTTNQEDSQSSQN